MPTTTGTPLLLGTKFGTSVLRTWATLESWVPFGRLPPAWTRSVTVAVVPAGTVPRFQTMVLAFANSPRLLTPTTLVPAGIGSKS